MAKLDCGIPPSPVDGTRTSNGTTFLSVAIYSCNNGFKLNGTRARYCNSQGRWSSSDPVCYKSTSKGMITDVLLREVITKKKILRMVLNTSASYLSWATMQMWAES